ncbi:ribonuclease J [Patescibacteria group bacterium]|nr:ribonuclease J [Patescibacteria group bacterium]MCL5797894.1 ribonuclease J [Patescibacteria group bacterium]
MILFNQQQTDKRSQPAPHQLSHPHNHFLRLIPLGGIGNVTKNMYVYEYRRSSGGEISDILIVDCGIGFPDEAMYGIDLVIPDITYLRDKKDKIRAIILTHGHEDHIAALPYILPDLKVPVYGTRLTAALAEVKLRDFGLQNHINTADTSQILHFGPFSVEFVHVTHSIPDATNLIIRTPVGIFYHGSDYKFDWTPIDGQQTEVGKIARVSSEGILCLLSDCVRVESPGYTLPERIIEDTLEEELRKCRGKFIFTTQSSNISRIQQAINVAVRNNRKIAFLGRSIVENVDVTKKLHYLEFPDIFVVQERELKRYKPSDLFLIVTGSQAQPNAALSRIADGSHKFVSINPGDTVIFSADPIPGYENAVHGLIDELTARGAKVAYSDIMDALHVSGHGAANDLALMIGLTRPKFILPIGGTIRQMRRYADMAKEMGYKDNQILLPGEGDVLEFDSMGNVRKGENIDLKNVMVDGLGVGDVGNVVIRDRQTMANEGIVVVVVPVEQSTGQVTAEPDIISRGFVYMKESTRLIDGAKKVVTNSLRLKKGRIFDWQFVRKQIEGRLEEFLYKETHRRPLIISVVVEV